MEPGIYYDMPEAKYHASRALSLSGMKEILRKSPRHFEYRYLQGNQQDKPAFAFGRALHAYVLQPELFNRQFAIAPDVDKRTKAGKEAYADFLSGNIDKQEVSQSDYDAIQAMSAEIHSHPTAHKLLSLPGKSEVSLFWDEDDVSCRSRFDYVADAGAIIDIKTTTDASPSGFSREAYNFGYHMQAYWYMRAYRTVTGRAPDSFTFIACEKQPPYCVGVYCADDAMLELGELDCEAALEMYRNCMNSRRWHGYADIIVPLNLPRYAENRLTYGD